MSLTASAPDLGRATAATEATPFPVPLVARLGAALDAAGVRYCMWKGHGKMSRWSVGEGDIDLLVDRGSEGAFAQTLGRLGFKPAIAGRELQIPGVVSWVAPDPALDRLLHVHAHFRLILGKAERTTHHLAIERAVLESALPRLFFKTPAPEHEFLLFVLQQTLRLDPLFAARDTEARLRTLHPELHRLQQQADPRAVARALTALVPEIGPDFFARCVDALRPNRPAWLRLKVRAALGWRLRATARRPAFQYHVRRLRRFATRLLTGRRNELPGGKQLLGGGAVIALIGADGAGKSTCAHALRTWLGSELRTMHAHLGRPKRSWTTLAVGALLKAVSGGRDAVRGKHDPHTPHRAPHTVLSHLELARHVATARDRYILFRKARAFAAEGGIAICERYPIPESYALAGPSKAQGLALEADSRLARGLRRLEERWYRLISAPDLTLVLRVEPEVAVRRKTDEPEDYVRARARRMWATDWSTARARIVDAGRSLPDVLGELRARVWESL